MVLIMDNVLSCTYPGKLGIVVDIRNEGSFAIRPGKGFSRAFRIGPITGNKNMFQDIRVILVPYVLLNTNRIHV